MHSPDMEVIHTYSKLGYLGVGQSFESGASSACNLPQWSEALRGASQRCLPPHPRGIALFGCEKRNSTAVQVFLNALCSILPLLFFESHPQCWSLQATKGLKKWKQILQDIRLCCRPSLIIRAFRSQLNTSFRRLGKFNDSHFLIAELSFQTYFCIHLIFCLTSHRSSATAHPN